MKVILFILIGLLCCQVVVHGEEGGPSSNLRKLLSLRAYFEAKEYYAANADSITDDFAKLYYGSMMDIVYNRPVAAVPKLERLLAEYRDSLNFRERVDMLLKLAEQFGKIGSYDKALALVGGRGFYIRQHETITRHDSLYFTENMTYYRMMYESLKNAPISLERDLNDDAVIKLYKKGKWDLTANIKCDGKKMKALFDTGVEVHAFMFEDKARKYGVKLGDPFMTQPNNGTASPASYGILPQICLGNVVLYNLPVLVFLDPLVGVDKETFGKKEYRELKKSIDYFDIAIGVPAMLLLEKLTFDFNKGTVIISRSQSGGSESNMLIDKITFFDVQANGQSFCPAFDTGSSLDAVIIFNDYYEQHKEFIPLDTLQTDKALFQMAYLGEINNNNREYDYPAKLIISVDGKDLDMTGNSAVFRTKGELNMEKNSGVLSYYFINNPQYPVAVLDFVNMKYIPMERRSKSSSK